MNGEEEEELLYRMDERLKRIEEEHMRRLSDIDKELGKVEAKADDNDKRIQRNSTIIKVMTGGIAAAFSTGAGWISGILHLPK